MGKWVGKWVGGWVKTDLGGGERAGEGVEEELAGSECLDE